MQHKITADELACILHDLIVELINAGELNTHPSIKTILKLRKHLFPGLVHKIEELEQGYIK